MKKLLWFCTLLALFGCNSPADDLGVPTMGPTPKPALDVPPLPELDSALIAEGETVYDLHCAECHGVTLEGETGWEDLNEDGSYRSPAHDKTGHTWQHSDARLIQIVKLGGSRVSPDVGVSNMPGYATVLAEREIVAVLTYIKSSWPDEIREIQWTVTIAEMQDAEDE